MKTISVKDFKEFDQLYQEYEQRKGAEDAKSIIALFVASPDPNTNESWCPDCRVIKPVIDDILEKFQCNDILVLATVNVGHRDEWKSVTNPFRNHDVHVTAVPTLLSLKTGIRLVEEECKDADKVSHLFSNSL